jgi:D-threo-aldose 1-dehydrogenase
MSQGFRREVANPSTLSLPKLGLGTAPLGGLYAAVGDEDSQRTLLTAFDAGMRYWDTAPFYGVGLAETRVGRALGLVERSEVIVSTKAGRVLKPGREASIFVDTPDVHAEFDFSARGVRLSVEQSCERLGVEHLDLVHLHDPDEHFEQARDEALPELVAMKNEGLVTAIGVGMNQAEILTRFVELNAFDCLLVAGRFSLLDQTAAQELLPACAEREVQVVVGGVFNSGILADPTEGSRYNYGSAPTPILERAHQLDSICARHQVPLRAAAVQFPYRHPAVSSVIVGARSAFEVSDAVEMSKWPIPTALWGELSEGGLI